MVAWSRPCRLRLSLPPLGRRSGPDRRPGAAPRPRGLAARQLGGHGRARSTRRRGNTVRTTLPADVRGCPKEDPSMRLSAYGAVLPALPLAAVLFIPPVAAAPLHVMGVSPRPQSLAVPRSQPLVVRFDQVLDPLSVDGGSLIVTGRSSGVVPGAVEAVNDRLQFTPARPLAPGDWVTARVAATV